MEGLETKTLDELRAMLVEIKTEIASRDGSRDTPVLITSDDIKEHAEDQLWHYNGGWFKTVTGLDKSKTDGYSLKGEFFGSGGDMKKIPGGSIMIKPGSLILDCSIQGSRKNQVKIYNLLHVVSEHTLEFITESKGVNWATDLWAFIENE